MEIHYKEVEVIGETDVSRWSNLSEYFTPKDFFI